MGLTEEEAKSVYEKLSEMAKHENLDWVVKDIEREITRGQQYMEVIEEVSLESSMAKDENLDWIAKKDIEREITLGQQYIGPIEGASLESSSDSEDQTKLKRKISKHVAMKKYSEQDKLRLLVEAIEAVSCGLNFAVAHVFQGLSDNEEKRITMLKFEPDVEPGEKFEIDISIQEKIEKTKELQKLLRELKEAI